MIQTKAAQAKTPTGISAIRGRLRPALLGVARRPGAGPFAPMWLATSVVLLLTLTGCRPAAETEAVDKAEIQTVLESYLPKLGQAYKTQNPKLLEDFVVPKEKARIQLRIDELEARGQIYEPIFKTVTVEDVSVWNHSNAFVSTLEVWDVSSYTLGSGLLVNQILDQRSRVKYQMKRKSEGWVVLYRELESTPGS